MLIGYPVSIARAELLGISVQRLARQSPKLIETVRIRYPMPD